MAKITVRLNGPVKQEIGEDLITLEGKDILTLLSNLDEKYGTETLETISLRENKNVSAQLQVAVNGELEKNLNKKLEDGDYVTILSLIGGG